MNSIGIDLPQEEYKVTSRYQGNVLNVCLFNFCWTLLQFILFALKCCSLLYCYFTLWHCGVRRVCLWSLFSLSRLWDNIHPLYQIAWAFEKCINISIRSYRIVSNRMTSHHIPQNRIASKLYQIESHRIVWSIKCIVPVSHRSPYIGYASYRLVRERFTPLIFI